MNLFQRLQDSFSGRFDELGDEFDDPSTYYVEELGFVGDRSAPNNVVGVSGWTRSPAEVVLMEPKSFEEIPQAVVSLRQRKSVILNVNYLTPDQAQRCVDYVAGAACAIDGHQERISTTVFLFTPSSVTISSGAAAVAPSYSANPIVQPPQPTPPSAIAHSPSMEVG